ncbi:MAG: hypothetical protein J6M02_03335 [Clostridia bacterium]|nr:hypothetical protein [Clostridia bacterium]
MDIEIFTQPALTNGENYNLGDCITDLLNSGEFTDVSFFIGLLKEDAYEKLFEHLKNFILSGGSVNFYLGYDKRRNLKKMVQSMLELGCNVYLYKENNSPEFQYKTVFFENTKNAKVLFSSGNFTMSGLYEGINTTISLNYSLRGKGKEDFVQLKESFLSKQVLDLFQQADRKNLELILGDGALPSIEEFTHKDVPSKTEIKTDLNDIAIDIEIDESVDFLTPPAEPVKKVVKESVKKEPPATVEKTIPEPIIDLSSEEPKYYMQEDAIDIESMLFQTQHETNPVAVPSTPTVKNPHYHNDIDEEPALEEEMPETESKIIMKNANLSKTSIFMIHAPKIAKKGVNAGEVKIPTYLRDLIPQFWGWPKDYKIDKINAEKYQNCILKIVDTKNPNDILTDNDAKLFQREGENNFNIYSKILMDMNINENDILRFIKTQSADGYYFCCEVVRQDVKEYPIWDQFCTTALKSSKRRYGMM